MKYLRLPVMHLMFKLRWNNGRDVDFFVQGLRYGF